MPVGPLIFPKDATAIIMDCHGPAGCLAYYLSLVCWEIGEHDNLLAHDTAHNSLLETARKTIKQWMQLCRQRHLLEECAK